MTSLATRTLVAARVAEARPAVVVAWLMLAPDLQTAERLTSYTLGCLLVRWREGRVTVN